MFCPPKLISGGQEALHQLVDCINNLGGEAYIVYVRQGEIYTKKCSPPSRFQSYNAPQAVKHAVQYLPNNYFVAPESTPELLEGVKNGIKCIWWLSVGFKNNLFDYQKLKNDIHLYQSEYARQFVKDSINPRKLYAVSDYIVIESIRAGNKKDEIALVQRKLDARYTHLIQKLKSGYKVHIVKNLSRHRLAKLLGKTKIFIDFGNHPGKDRLPREAAMFNNIIITSTLGASENGKDVQIRDDYKLSYSIDPKTFDSFIQICLLQYHKKKQDFISYKQLIINEKSVFFNEVNSVFRLQVPEAKIEAVVAKHCIETSSVQERLSESYLVLKLKKLIEYVRVVIFKVNYP